MKIDIDMAHAALDEKIRELRNKGTLLIQEADTLRIKQNHNAADQNENNTDISLLVRMKDALGRLWG